MTPSSTRSRIGSASVVTRIAPAARASFSACPKPSAALGKTWMPIARWTERMASSAISPNMTRILPPITAGAGKRIPSSAVPNRLSSGKCGCACQTLRTRFVCFCRDWPRACRARSKFGSLGDVPCMRSSEVQPTTRLTGIARTKSCGSAARPANAFLSSIASTPRSRTSSSSKSVSHSRFGTSTRLRANAVSHSLSIGRTCSMKKTKSNGSSAAISGGIVASRSPSRCRLAGSGISQANRSAPGKRLRIACPSTSASLRMPYVL